MKKTALFIVTFVICMAFHATLVAQVGPGKHEPHAAFDAYTNAYLLTYDYNDPDNYIRGQLLNSDATALGAELAVSVSQQAIFQNVAYDRNHGTYLVVWNQRDDGDNDIYGQFIDGAGMPILGNFRISDAPSGDQWRPSVAFDDVNGRFLVVWVDERTLGTFHLYGQLVNGDGTLFGDNFVVFDGADVGGSRAMAYDALNQRFLISWHDARSGTNGIYGLLVNADGTISGADFAISEPAPQDQSQAAAVFNPETGQYLVVWQDKRNAANYDVYAQLVNADGTLDGGNSMVTNLATNEQYPAAAYDNVNNRFFVIWNHYIAPNDAHVFGQFIQPDGVLSGDAFQLSTDINSGPYLSLTFNPLCSNYLVSFVFALNPADPTELKNLIFGDPCETTPPTVTATNPAADATDVPVDAVITVAFSENMRASTITANSLFLDNDVVGTVSYDAATQTATFTPTENLEQGTTYTATITTAVKDLVGNAMASAMTWSFTTAAAPAPTPGGGCSLIPQRRRN